MSLHTSEVVEQLWVSLSLSGRDRLLLGCLYLSPSGDRHLSMMDLDVSLKAACEMKSSHILIAGDFNVPQIDWSSGLSDEPPNHYSHRLVECIQDHYLIQHVTKPTRYRPGQVPNILDLILSNEEGMVHDLKYMPCLGGSDHVVLRFTMACYTERVRPGTVTRNYNKGNYDLLRSRLEEVDWSMMKDANMDQASTSL